MESNSNHGPDMSSQNVEESDNAQSVKFSSTRRVSEVWEFFQKTEEVKNGIVKLKAKCVLCGDLLVRGGNSGTKHLLRHMSSCKKSVTQNTDVRTQMQIGINASGNMPNFKYDKNVARKEIVEFIVRSELPFTFVEKNDFNGMIQRSFQPQFTGFSAATCKRDVMRMFLTSKAELIKFFSSFEGNVCVTTDVWSSRQKMGYMSLTAHFIDKEWTLNKRILSFKMIEYPHSGEALAQHMNVELIAWQIHTKVFSVTLDNASNNDSLMNLLPDYLMLNEVYKQVFHVRCCAHVLNLIVQDGLGVLSESIDKITSIVRSMNSSNKRHEIWVHACADLGLSKKNIDIDIPTRWNSTHELLVTALKYKAALNRYVLLVNESRNVSLHIPNESDWLVASLICDFLSIFNTSTKICCGVYTPTSSSVINCLVDIYLNFQLYSSEYPIFQNALRVMKLKFDKYWSTFPMVFCLATIMDPRCKLFAIEEWLKCYGLSEYEVGHKMDKIKSCLHSMYEFYKRRVIPVTPTPVHVPSDAPDHVNLIPMAHSVSSWSRLKRARVSSSTSCLTSDMQMYLDLATIEVDDDSSFDLLGWWKSNCSMYPILSILAKDLLSVPASSVASEAAFSAGGRVVSEKRAALSPSTIEALVCLKDWSLAIRRKQEEAREEEVVEELINLRAARPEWLEEPGEGGSNQQSVPSGLIDFTIGAENASLGPLLSL